MEYCGNSNCRKNLTTATLRRKRICKNCLRKFCSKCFSITTSNPFKMRIEGYCYDCYIHLNPDNLQYNKYFGEAIPSEKSHQDFLSKNTQIIKLDPFSEFKMIKELGQGATSQVFQVLSKTSEVFALKVLKSSIDFKFVQEEYVASIQVASPNIIRSYSLYQFKKNYSILLEYCDFTLFSLLHELKGRGENVLAFILREVLKGLIALHQKYIIHRDIKCENIFVNRDGEVKLGDFGMAAQLVRERDSRLTSAGTPYWEAPEVLSGKSYTTSCDIWSFGITSFELATGSPPHSNCLTILSLITKLKSEDPPRLPEDFSPSFSQFIESCLQKDPENRKQASVLLLSPFLLNIDEINAKNDLLSVISSHQSRPLKP